MLLVARPRIICVNVVFLETLQTIDMILSMYESSIPMRFGVLLYSSKMIKLIEEGRELPAASTMHDSQKVGEDISSSVISCHPSSS